MPACATIQAGAGRLRTPVMDVIGNTGMYNPHGVFDGRADPPAETNLAASPHWVRWDR